MAHFRLLKALRVLASVRMRAGVVVLLAVLPLIGLMVCHALIERNTLLVEAQLRALETARLLAERQDTSTRELTTLLAAARRIPAVSTLDPQLCPQELSIVVLGRPDQLELSVADTTGHLVCSSLPEANGIDISKTPSFRRLMEQDGPQRLQTFVPRGRIRGNAVSLSQMPIFAPDGKRIGVITASLPFSWLTRIAQSLKNWTENPIFLIDEQTGESLAQSIEPDGWVGKRFPDHPVLQAYHAAPGVGVITAPNPRGVNRIFGYAPLQAVGGQHVLVVVGLDRSTLLVIANRELTTSLALALALGFFSIVNAWWAAHLSLVRPIRQLVQAAQHLGTSVTRLPFSLWHAPELRLLEARLRERSRRLASAQAIIAASEAAMRLLAESTSDIIFRLNHEMHVLYVSPAVQEILGCSPEAFVEGRILAIHPDDLAQVQARFAEMKTKGISRVTARWQGASEWIWLETMGRLAADGSGYVCVMRDVTGRRAADERIHHMAHHDGLTDLPNRMEMHQQLQIMLDQARESGETTCLLYIDLDHFKRVNDSLGHAAGDEVLRQVGGRLRNFLDKTVESIWAGTCLKRVAGRLGGDEFAVALFGELSESNLANLSQTLLTCLCSPMLIGKHTVQVGASIGVACYPQHGDTVTALTRNADAALYDAKQAGRNGFALFNPALVEQQRRRQQLEYDLQLAVGTDQLRLVYQPILTTRSLEVVGVEALLRWQHPSLGFITPTEFIRVAEESGQIEALGLWVLRTACAEAASWSQGWTVAVNLSPVQVQRDGLPDQVARILADTGLPGHRLKLEITEGMLIQDEQRAKYMMCALQEQGVSISLDDFGTGYASLSYLNGLPFDTLKIDRSLVQHVASEKQRSIIQAILALAKALDMDVIAEGVETAKQLEVLRQMGCPMVQGYLLGHPMPIDNLHVLRTTTFGESVAGAERSPQSIDVLKH